jgi:hypothetical protein
MDNEGISTYSVVEVPKASNDQEGESVDKMRYPKSEEHNGPDRDDTPDLTLFLI